MPRCGSQCVLCDFPVRLDTYAGCTHACRYCFTQRKNKDGIAMKAKVENHETPDTLRKFIAGDRRGELEWCDWDIPIHWGGLSDPFQPVEVERKRSLECLKIFAETKYPFIVSTKGRAVVLPEYLELLSQCNVVMQISLVAPEYDELEPGAPPFLERVEMIRKLSKVCKRVNVRHQPYMIDVFDSVMNITMPSVYEAGAYGVVVEGMKFYDGKRKGTIQNGADFVYPLNVLQPQFEAIRDRAHEIGLKFYCGENRLRWMGDSLSCCGADGLDGFKPNEYNLNHIYAGENPQPTEAQKKNGSTTCFKTLCQCSWASEVLDQLTFENVMREIAKSKYGYQTMGLDTEDKNRVFDI